MGRRPVVARGDRDVLRVCARSRGLPVTEQRPLFKDSGWTHDALVERAARWAKGSLRCSVVLAEFNNWSPVGDPMPTWIYKCADCGIYAEVVLGRWSFGGSPGTWRGPSKCLPCPGPKPSIVKRTYRQEPLTAARRMRELRKADRLRAPLSPSTACK